jgi:hypothetical protein
MERWTVRPADKHLGAGLMVLVLVLAMAGLVADASGSCFTPPAGLVGWWPGDGGANDIAGTNNGTLQGGATAAAAGVVGQAFGFDGTNSYVQVPNNAALRPANLTVEAWVLFTSLDSAASGSSPPGQQFIVFKQNTRSKNTSSSSFAGYYLGKERRTNGDILVFEVAASSGKGAEVDSGPLVTTGVWYHVAGVRGANFIQLYINGQLVGQTNVNFAQNYGTLPLYFGTSGQSSWDHKLKGSLDEVSLYNRTLSASEIAAIYAAGAAGKCKTVSGLSITTQPQSQSVAAGTNALFTVVAAGAAPLGYQWRYNGTAIAGANSTSLTLANVQPANEGSYTVVVTNSTAAVTSAVAVLTVLVPPIITAQPESLTNVTGTAASFSATATGSAPLGYQWQLNGVSLANGGRVSGARTNTLSVTNVQPADAGSYTLVVSNAAGVVTSAVAVLTITGPPMITVQPASQSVAVGTNAGFSVIATGTPPLSYQWLFGTAPITDATNASLILTNVQPADAGSFTVVVTNSAGSATSAVAVLTVVLPPLITAQPQSLTNVTGAAATFSATATGSPPLGYQWRLNGVNLSNGGRISGARTNTLSVTNVESVDTGSYTLVVSNAAGIVTSAVATLTVISPPSITAQPVSQSIVAGSNASFSVIATGTSPLSYQWLLNGTNLADTSQIGGSSSSTLSILNVQPTNAGGYSVVVTNVAESVTSAVVVLTVVVPGSCLVPPTGLVAWWPGDGNANDITGTNNGTLQGDATANTAGMVAQTFGFDGTNSYVQILDSPVLKPTNLTVEAWVNFSGLDSALSGTAPAGDQYIVFKQNSLTYYFEGYSLEKYRLANGDAFMFTVGSASGLEVVLLSKTLVSTSVWYHVAAVRGSNFMQLYVNGKLEGQTNVSFAQNYGTLPLYFGTSHETYWDGKLKGRLDEVSLYNRALSSNEVATIYAAGAAGKCKVVSGLTITSQPQSQTLAAGSSATFTVAAAGAAPLNYQWQFNGTNLSGATGTSLILAGVQPANAGSYRVVVTNATASLTSAVAILTVLLPPVIAAQPQSLTNVAGTLANFTATATGSAPLGYQWQLNGTNLANGGRISGARTNSLSITNVQPTDAGSYALVVSNAVGVATSAVATLAVSGPPVITGQPASQNAAAGSAVTFSVTATGTSPLSYQWRFNGTDLVGATNTRLTLPAVQPANGGSYTAVVTNSVGSATSSVAVLTVLPAAGTLTINGAQTYQTIDGFGVNANHRSWTNNELQPVLDALIDQAGMTLFHVIFDNNNWEATNDNSDPNVMNWTYYNSVYSAPEFQKLWGIMRYLNQRGITNGLVPDFEGPVALWMGGLSLTPGLENEYAETIASLLVYARYTNHLQFKVAGPVNEPDNTYAGIHLTGPAQYVTVMHDLAQQLDNNGLSDVRFSGPDLAYTDTSWLGQIMTDPVVMAKLAHFGLHSYQNLSRDSTGVYNFIQQSAYPDRHFWMTEFNVWCSSCVNGTGGNNSWAFGRGTATWLLNHLANGASAGLVWEGYDSQLVDFNSTTGGNNPPHWSYFGLFAVDNINAAVKTYTARKGFYTVAQIAKFVRPSAQRIDVSGSSTPLTVLAFYNTNNGQFTLTGANTNSSASSLSCALTSLPTIPTLDFYYTSSTTNLCYGAQVGVNNGAFAVTVPADCVFTLTYTNPVTTPAAQPVSSVATNPPTLYGLALNGEFQLTIAGQAGQQYAIEVSEDLVNWNELTTVTNQDGITQISAPTSATVQFYRAKLLP